MNPTRHTCRLISTLVILAMLLQAVPVRADELISLTPTSPGARPR